MSILNLPLRSGGNLSVEEQATEDGWHIRRYSDGFIEMTYNGPEITITPDKWIQFNPTSTNYYYPLNSQSGQPLPVELTAKDFEVGSYSSTQNSYLTLISYIRPSLELTAGYGALCFGKPSNTEVCALSIYVRGRWK